MHLVQRCFNSGKSLFIESKSINNIDLTGDWVVGNNTIHFGSKANADVGINKQGNREKQIKNEDSVISDHRTYNSAELWKTQNN